MILVVILIILIIFFLLDRDSVQRKDSIAKEDTLLKNLNMPGPLNRIREGETGIVTKGSYNIPYVRIRTEIQDMFGV